MFHSRGVFFCVFLIVCSVQGNWASADEQVFTDWRVACRDDAKKASCQMLQSTSVSAEGSDVFLLSISATQDEKDSYGVITVPIGVYIAPGIEISVDNRRPFKIFYEVCDQSGCHAGFKLSGAVLTAFMKGNDAKVRVWVGKTRAVDFPVSLRGFSAAYRHYQLEISG